MIKHFMNTCEKEDGIVIAASGIPLTPVIYCERIFVVTPSLDLCFVSEEREEWPRCGNQCVVVNCTLSHVLFR